MHSLPLPIPRRLLVRPPAPPHYFFARSCLWLALILVAEGIGLRYVSFGEGLERAPAFVQDFARGVLWFGPWIGGLGAIGSLGMMRQRAWGGKLLALAIAAVGLGALFWGGSMIRYLFADPAPQVAGGKSPAAALAAIVPILAVQGLVLTWAAITAWT